jgi:hypothetical protein
MARMKMLLLRTALEPERCAYCGCVQQRQSRASVSRTVPDPDRSSAKQDHQVLRVIIIEGYLHLWTPSRSGKMGHQ